MKSVQQAAANWQGASGRAQTAWVAGITNTQKDQAALAAAAQPRWLQGVQDAAANNRFANGVTRRGTGYWKSQSESKQSNYSTGYAAGVNNYTSAAQKLLPFLAQAVPGLPARGDINQNLQRSAQLAMQLHQARGQFKAG